MILTALMELAQREGLIENPDYQPMPVRWLIDIDEKAKVLGVADTLRRPEGSKGKPEARNFAVPKRSKRTSAPLSEFLVDKPSYVLGWVHSDVIEDNVRKGKKTEDQLLTLAETQHNLYLAEL